MTFTKRFWGSVSLTVLSLCAVAAVLLAPFYAIYLLATSVLGSLIGIFFCGHTVFRDAWRSLRDGAPARTILVASAILVLLGSAVGASVVSLISYKAFIFVPYAITSILIAGVLVTLWLGIEAVSQHASTPDKAEEYAAAVVSSRYELPKETMRIERGEKKIVAVSALKTGDVLLLDEGMVIPADGLLLEGIASLDESMITADDTEQKRFPNQKLFAGSRVVSGRFLLRVAAVGKDTFVQSIVSQSVTPDEALAVQARKRIALTTVFTAGFSVIIAGLWTLISTDVAATITASVLVLGTTLAAGWAVTASVEHSKRIARKQGIMLRDAAALADIAQSDIVVFDRSVLSIGEPSVEHVISFKPYTQQQVLNLAAALENKSEHPVGKAIVQFSKKFGALSLQQVDSFEEVEGRGVSGLVNGKKMLAGNALLMDDNSIVLPAEAFNHKDAGKTIVYIVSDGALMGYVALRDPISEHGRDVVTTAKSIGRTVLLSGDHNDTAAAVGKDLGVQEVIGQVPSSQTRDKLAELGKHKRVLFVTRDEKLSDAAPCVVIVGGRNLSKAAATVLSSDAKLVGALIRLSLASQTRSKQNRHVATAVTALMLPIACGVFVFWTPVALTFVVIAVVSSSTQMYLAWNASRI